MLLGSSKLNVISLGSASSSGNETRTRLINHLTLRALALNTMHKCLSFPGVHILFTTSSSRAHSTPSPDHPGYRQHRSLPLLSPPAFIERPLCTSFLRVCDSNTYWNEEHKPHGTSLHVLNSIRRWVKPITVVQWSASLKTLLLSAFSTFHSYVNAALCCIHGSMLLTQTTSKLVADVLV